MAKKGHIPWNKGRKHSEETLKKISLALKGKLVWNKGKKGIYSIESRKKMSAWQTGRKLTKEHKEKISLKLKGRKFTPEHRERIGNKHKGRLVSIKTRERLRVSQSGIKSHMFGKRGAETNNWKGGVTPLNKAIRKIYKYRQWVSDVFTRDDFTCTFCGVRGGELEVDHIIFLSTLIKDNNINQLDDAEKCSSMWDINNGRTLCIKCHRNRHIDLNLFKNKII